MHSTPMMNAELQVTYFNMFYFPSSALVIWGFDHGDYAGSLSFAMWRHVVW